MTDHSATPPASAPETREPWTCPVCKGLNGPAVDWCEGSIDIPDHERGETEFKDDTHPRVYRPPASAGREEERWTDPVKMLCDILNESPSIRVVFDPLNDSTLNDAQKLEKARGLIDACGAEIRRLNDALAASRSESSRLREAAKSWRKFAMRCATFLRADQIAEAAKAAGIQATFCGPPDDDAALSPQPKEGASDGRTPP